MSLNNILTSIALGFGIVGNYLTLDLMYTAMYRDNKDGIACIDCNSYGEGNLEVVLLCIVVLISLYTFFISLSKLV